jgi:hypothetical protein
MLHGMAATDPSASPACEPSLSTADGGRASAPGWSSFVVDGHAVELFVPASQPDRPPGGLLHLRDVDDRPPSQSQAWHAAIASSPLPVVSLSGGGSWWLDRVVPRFDARCSPEAFVVHTLAGWIQERFGIPAAAVAVVGQGSGGQGALRLAYRHPAAFPVAAAVLPTIDFHRTMHGGEPGSETLWEVFGDVEAARQETAILHVHPLNWPRHQAFHAHAGDIPSADASERLHSKLIALGIPHEAELAGRAEPQAWLSTATAAAVRFAVDRLERDSRRIG